MNIQKEQLSIVLSQLNPWWRGERISDLPDWHRAAFHELYNWIKDPPAARAIFLSGARQVGKTTLLLQVIARLAGSGGHLGNILYATFDHPVVKLAGIDSVLEVWRERQPEGEGAEFIFLDEAHFISDHEVWIKHQVDFSRIAGSFSLARPFQFSKMFRSQVLGAGTAFV